MAARGSMLGRKQEDAIAALLTQRNVEEAARAAGIGSSKEPDRILEHGILALIVVLRAKVFDLGLG